MAEQAGPVARVGRKIERKGEQIGGRIVDSVSEFLRLESASGILLLGAAVLALLAALAVLRLSLPRLAAS